MPRKSKVSVQKSYKMKNQQQTNAIVAIDRRVRRLEVSPEIKHIDTFNTTNCAYDVNFAVALIDPAQGTGSGDRVGDQLKPRFININGQVSAGGSGGEEVVRLMLIRAKHRFNPNTTVSSGDPEAIFEVGGGVRNPIQNFDWDNREHYTVLKDLKMIVNDTTAGLSNSSKLFNIKYRCPKSAKTLFDQATSTAEAGQVYFVCTSDQPNASNPPVIKYVARVWFTDE